VERHWSRASAQALYSFESPHTGADRGIYRAGLSAKADLILGFQAEALWAFNPVSIGEAGINKDGLSVSAGCDYSFFDGDLYLLAEYLFNGRNSSTSPGAGNIFGFSGEHFLYTGAVYCLNDYTSLTTALSSAFSDYSFSPHLGIDYEIFQGLTLSALAQIPLDRDSASGDGNRGELGPIPPGRTGGSSFLLTLKARLRF
jgi:hypothetical protein